MRYTAGKLFSRTFRSCEQLLSSTSVQKSCVKCLPYRWCGYLTPGRTELLVFTVDPIGGISVTV